MLILSNPYDDKQRRDAFFTGPGEPSEEAWRAIWINTMRSDYCDTKDLNGINYYYTSVFDQSIHTEPYTIQSRVEEANFVADIPGAMPYPCEVAP